MSRTFLKLLAIIAAVGAIPDFALAGGPCSGVKGGCGRSSYSTTPRTSAPSYNVGSSSSSSSSSKSSGGDVHVQGYYRKDGTYVHSHTRSKPGSGSTSHASSETYRTVARTVARTATWNGTGSISDAEEKRRYAPAIPPSQVILAPRFIVHFHDRTKKQVVDYTDRGSSYLVTLTTGGSMALEKSLVDTVEPISAERELPRLVTVSESANGNVLVTQDGVRVRMLGILSSTSDGIQTLLQREIVGQPIRLVYDDKHWATKHRDKYEQLLAYVVRAKDDLDFNKTLVKFGYAAVDSIPEFSRETEYRELESSAKTKRLGIWK